MFRGGRLGGIQGAAGAAFANRHEFDEILKTTSSLKRVKTGSSSMLTTVANSPKWIKLDGIHQRYVRRVKLQGVAWILSTKGSVFIGIAIAVQSLVMGLELQLELQASTTLREQGGPAFYILVVVDCILLLIFCVEYILRARVLKRKYLCSFSGLLDLMLVLSAFGYISVIQLSHLQPDDTMKGVVRAVRLLRILRVVHLLQIMPALALLVKGLVSTIITIMDAMILLAIISYIGALICSEVLGRKDPQFAHFFGSVPLSFLTHIQLVLVEGWPAIGGPMLGDSRFWAAYLVIFICLSNFALLNLVTGVVCERVMELARQLPPATSEEKLLEYDILKQQVAELFDATEKRCPDYLNQHEYTKFFKSVLAGELLDRLKVTLPSHNDLLRCLIDEDDNGKVTCAELQQGLMRLRGNRFDDVSRAMQCTGRKCAHRSIRSLDEADVDLKSAMSEVLQNMGHGVKQQLHALDDDLLTHLDEDCARRRKDTVRKQQKHLLETTCAMKSLKYAISSLQKECSDAFVPDCGALTCFKGSRSGQKPIHKITQTVEDVDSQSNTAP